MRDIMEGLLELQHAYDDHMRQHLGADCAHPRQAPILCLLLSMDGVSQAELMRELNVSASTVAISIGRLERLGYVRRERNSRNQRAYVIGLTPEGRRQALTLRQAMQAACCAAARGMGEGELRQLMSLIYRMTDNLRGASGHREQAAAE